MRAFISSFIGFAMLEQEHYIIGIAVLTYTLIQTSKLIKKYGH
jgi:hypothetical protein